MRVYVASSWRCERQPSVVRALREGGHEIYDFRNPGEGRRGFSWAEVAPPGYRHTYAEPMPADLYVESMRHPRASEGFALDAAALRWCEACVLVLPCGRSAHLELGWAAGAGKRTAVLLDDPCTPELMYGMATAIATRVEHVLEALRW